MASIQLSSGPVNATFEIPADCDTVGQVLDFFREQLNIPTDANATVNGDPADADAPVSDGDEVAFTKTAGSKG